MSRSSEILRKLSSMSHRNLLARLIWGEARGELPVGQLAVAHVVVNRVELGRYGAKGGLKGVILKPWQFSCFDANDPNLPLLLQPPMREPFTCCLLLAELVLVGLTVDPTGGLPITSILTWCRAGDRSHGTRPRCRLGKDR